MNRRKFVTALGAFATFAMQTPVWADVGNPRILAAAGDGLGGYFFVGLDESGEKRFETPIPIRAHGFAVHPHHAHALVFARRPGTQAYVVDLVRAEILHTLDLGEAGYFQGHGVYSPDGALAYMVESRIDQEEGLIGIWDVAAGYKRIGEVAGLGIGPHELIALSDGGYALANGGILLDPATGRKKLNLATMAPSLVVYDRNLNVRYQHFLPPKWHQLSIRHMAEKDGIIALGFQWEGDVYQKPPMIALADAGGIRLIEGLAQESGHYIGSVAVSGAGHFGFSAPKTGHLLRVDPNGEILPPVALAGIYGICAAGDGFFGTADGQTYKIGAEDVPEITPLSSYEWSWDNHLLARG